MGITMPIDKITMSMLSKLSKDELSELFSRQNEDDLVYLADSEDLKYCGKVCYEVLAEDPDWWVRERLAKNPTLGEVCGKECMLKLADDNEKEVRWSLAYNRRLGEVCGKDCMIKLIEDEDKDVGETICLRKDLSKYCPECVSLCEQKYGIRSWY